MSSATNSSVGVYGTRASKKTRFESHDVHGYMKQLQFSYLLKQAVSEGGVGSPQGVEGCDVQGEEHTLCAEAWADSRMTRQTTCMLVESTSHNDLQSATVSTPTPAEHREFRACLVSKTTHQNKVDVNSNEQKAHRLPEKKE